MKKHRNANTNNLLLKLILHVGLVLGVVFIFYGVAQCKAEPPIPTPEMEITISHDDELSIGEITIDFEAEKEVEIIESECKPNYDLLLSDNLQDLVWEVSKANELSYELALAVMYVEDRTFNPSAKNINKDGTIDRGLFQINSRSVEDYRKYAIEYGGLDENVKFDVINSEHSIRAGIGGLARHKKLYSETINKEDLDHYILGTYNRGETGYKNYIRRNGYISTDYSNKVLEVKQNLLENGKLN